MDESDGQVEGMVWRTGTDLSKAASVTVRSRKTAPASAEGRIPPRPLAGWPRANRGVVWVGAAYPVGLWCWEWL